MIEIDKRGLLTTVGFLILVSVVFYIAVFASGNYIIAKIGLTIGGLGIAFLWFLITATIQQGEEEERKRKEWAKQPIATPLTYKTTP